MKIRAALLFGLVVVGAPPLVFGQDCTDTFTTTITVDWALDPKPSDLKETCTYCRNGSVPCTDGLIFPAADGRCTIRRALREAGARPATDRPILIRFTGLNTGGGAADQADDGQYDTVNDQWRLFVDGNSNTFKLGDLGIGEPELGQVTIRGPAPNANGMPRVFLDGTDAAGDNNPYTMAIHTTDNQICRMGFLRGGDYIVINSGKDNQLIKFNTFGLHPDGDKIEHIDPDNVDGLVGAVALAGNNGILIRGVGGTDNVRVEENFFAGMEVAAVQAETGTTNVVVRNNHVGTAIDGSVPVLSDELKCNVYSINPLPNPNTLNANSWYGGDGIDVSGTGALIDGNVIAGLHTHRSGGVKEPVAIKTIGEMATVQNNVIGLDDTGYPAGVCGEAIWFGGSQTDDHQVLNNDIYRSRETINYDGPIVWADDTFSAVTDGGNTVRANRVFDAEPSLPALPTDRVYEMQTANETIKLFEPAEITSIVGTTVAGQACALSPCPLCEIDFYRDDADDRNEALEYLGMATADASGSFSFTLSEPLAPGFGIRTMTTSVSNGQIGNTGAGTTSRESSTRPLNKCGGLYCPATMTLENQTISGTQTLGAASSATLGQDLVIDGTGISVNAPTVAFVNDVEIRGTFQVGNTTNCFQGSLH